MTANRFNFRAYVKKYNKIYRVCELHTDNEYLAVQICDNDNTVVFDKEKQIEPNLFLENEIELMQSTGLVDKNGKEIFEGDIIKITLDKGKPYSRTYVEKVSWDDKNYCFLFGGEQINCLLYAFSETTMEVIGNIYENKELLGK